MRSKSLRPPPSQRPRQGARPCHNPSLTRVGSGGADADGVSEISVLTSYTRGTPEGAPFYGAVEEFTRRTGIQVRVVEGAENVADLYETSVLAGQEPNIMITNLAEKSTSG